MDRNLLKTVVLDQAELREVLSRRHIGRDVPYDRLQRALSAPNILVITGVRRCGKSALAASIFSQFSGAKKTFATINFDDERLINFTAKDFDLLLSVFYELYGSEIENLVFDEIQNIPGWELFLSRLRQTKKCIVTGSNANLLSSDLATHLTGRYSQYTLWPFSFAEYLRWCGESFDIDKLTTASEAQLVTRFQEYAVLGGFPESYQLGTEIVARLFSDIIDRDISLRYRIEPTAIKNLALYLISHLGCDNSVATLTKLIGTKDPRTTGKYLRYLTDSYLMIVLNKYSPKLKSQLLSSKKIYAIDHGMAKAVSISPTNSDSRRLENMVLLHLLRNRSDSSEKIEIYFWEDAQRKAQLDFVVRSENNSQRAIQVCHDISAPQARARELRAFELAGFEAGFNNAEQLLLTSSHTENISIADGSAIKSNVRCLPVWRFLLEM